MVPKTPVQVYGNLDRAFVDFVHSLQWRERPLITVFASPERAWGQLRYWLKQHKMDTETIPLPFGSVDRLSEEYDPSRFNNANLFRIAHNVTEGKWYGMRRPLPYTFLYQFDLWARNKKDLDLIGTQLSLRQRADECYLLVDFPQIPNGDCSGFVQLWTLMLSKGCKESSQLEPGAKDQRVLRRSFTYEVKGWKVFEPEEHGIVEQVRTEVYQTEDMVTTTGLLDTIVVTV